jgi:DNA invertase Pin-like site-specific DNA recombinase
MARKSRKLPPSGSPEQTVPKAIVYDAWGYTRISVDGDKSDDSIENQADIIRDYVKGKPDIALKRVITADLGYTGTNFDRPGYLELMDGINDGDVRCVIVKDLSRLGRSYIEVGELLFNTFPTCNVRFISVNDDYDSFADDAGRKKLLILFKNLINHAYSRDLRAKIQAAYSAKRHRGEPIGQPPYGYLRSEDGSRLVIDHVAADVIREIFNLRLQGVSARNIAKHLTRESVPSPQQRRSQLWGKTSAKRSAQIVWTSSVICSILRNEVYLGSLIQGKCERRGNQLLKLPKEMWTIRENAHEPIISREQFDDARKLTDAVSEKHRAKGLPTPENRYVGKIYCARCGKTVQRSCGGRRERATYYYVCHNCRDDLKSEHNIKRLPSLSLVKLDELVSDTLRTQMNLLLQYDKLAPSVMHSDALKQKRAALTREKARLDKALAGTDNTISAAYTHFLDGILDGREYELVREKAYRDKNEAEMRLEYVSGELRKLDVSSVDSNQWRHNFGTFRDFDVPTKELLQALVSRITLTPITNDISIEFNYMDSFAELRDLIAESGVSVNV